MPDPARVYHNLETIEGSKCYEIYVAVTNKQYLMFYKYLDLICNKTKKM